MICPNCHTTHSIITRTWEEEGAVKRDRLCLACKLRFETTEQYSGTVEGQVFQAALFRDMVSDESRAKAREIIERNGKHGA